MATADESKIALAPEDWHWATWRHLPPLRRPEPRPFDLDDWVARAGRVRKVFDTIYPDLDPDLAVPEAGFDLAMSKSESRLWFLLFTEPRGWEVKPKDLVPQLAASAENYSGALTLEGARERLENNVRVTPKEVMIPLASLFTSAELLELIVGPLKMVTRKMGMFTDVNYHLRGELAQGFAAYVVPYLTAREKESLRALLAPLLDPTSLSGLHIEHTLPASFYVAARLGMSRDMAAITATWADDAFGGPGFRDHYSQPQLLVFGLDSPRAVEAEFRRLGLKLKSSLHVRAWLACTELAALDVIRDSILAAPKRESAEELLAAFAKARAPEAAPYMLELTLNSKASVAAGKWLEENPVCAIPGLMPVAARLGKLGDAAVQFLRDMRKRGHQELVESHLSQLMAARAEKVRGQTQAEQDARRPAFTDADTPAWWREAVAADGARKSKGPEWLRARELPPVVIGGRRLNEAQVLDLCRVLQAARLPGIPALIAALRQHADPASRDAFAWDLFEAWERQGFPSKDKWALGAVGLLGGDASVLKLTPLIRAWPGQSQHQRAAFGLECLRAIGSDAALMQLSGIAQKLKFQALKKRGAACMEAIAKERGLSQAELEDCIVPDCDLDENGSRIFDFGPRRFTFALNKDLKPMVRDEAGKLKSNLPKPGAKDDADKAAAALAAWNLLKKTLREVLKTQSQRLERAMVTGRRWPHDRFETQLVRHPLLTHLVRRLVWGVYEGADDLKATFRVTDERDCADARDQPFDPAAAQKIGIVHPAHLSPADAGEWGELFGEYEIISPFPQLGRTVYKLEPGEEMQTEITRFKNVQVEGMILSGILSRQGWAGNAFSGDSSLAFPGAGVTAVLEYSGDYYSGQSIGRCYFVAAASDAESQVALKLGDVHPVALSETLRYLHAIGNAAKQG